MTKLDEAMKALELFPTMTPDIRKFLITPIIEEHNAQQERAFYATIKPMYVGLIVANTIYAGNF